MALRHNLLGLSGVVCAWLAGSNPVSAADLGYMPPAPSGWQFNFTPGRGAAWTSDGQTFNW